jgi:hypothetical protein
MKNLFPAAFLCCFAAVAQASCPAYLDGTITGYPSNPVLTEISGLAASRQAAGIFWTHNDSGDGPYFYALDQTGAHRGRWELDGVSATDWEDIAVGPGPETGREYVYIGDVGDNAHNRLMVTVYRVPAPAVPASGPWPDEVISQFDTLHIQYPLMTAYDCETLFADPLNGDLYLVTKDSKYLYGASYVFQYPAPQNPAATEAVTLAATIPSEADTLPYLITAGDAAPDGGAVILRSYSFAWLWQRPEGGALYDAFLETPCAVPLAPDIQGEAIAFAAAGRDYYTASEESVLNEPQPIRRYEFYEAEEEGEPGCVNSRGGLFETGTGLCLRIPGELNPGPPYQWMRDSAPLVSDGRVNGALSRSLRINVLYPQDTGLYSCAYRDGAKADQVFGPVSVVVADEVPAMAPAGLVLLGLALLMACRGKKRKHCSRSGTRAGCAG